MGPCVAVHYHREPEVLSPGSGLWWSSRDCGSHHRSPVSLGSAQNAGRGHFLEGDLVMGNPEKAEIEEELYKVLFETPPPEPVKERIDYEGVTFDPEESLDDILTKALERKETLKCSGQAPV